MAILVMLKDGFDKKGYFVCSLSQFVTKCQKMTQNK